MTPRGGPDARGLLGTLLMKTLLKVMIALVAVGVLAVLFVRSARSTRAEPFTIARQHLTGWTLTLAPDADPLGSLLSNHAEGGVDAAARP